MQHSVLGVLARRLISAGFLAGAPSFCTVLCGRLSNTCSSGTGRFLCHDFGTTYPYPSLDYGHDYLDKVQSQCRQGKLVLAEKSILHDFLHNEVEGYYSDLPQKAGRQGKLVKEVAFLPLAEDIPITFNSCHKGP